MLTSSDYAQFYVRLICARYKMGVTIIGVSVSEPHTSELNFLIEILFCMFLMS